MPLLFCNSWARRHSKTSAAAAFRSVRWRRSGDERMPQSFSKHEGGGLRRGGEGPVAYKSKQKTLIFLTKNYSNLGRNKTERFNSSQIEERVREGGMYCSLATTRFLFRTERGYAKADAAGRSHALVDCCDGLKPTPQASVVWFRQAKDKA